MASADTSGVILPDASEANQQEPNRQKIAIKLRVSSAECGFQSRCQPDLHNATVQCTAKPTNDDRQCISQFFGRNKRHTATIPKEYFPVLCRTHYQEKSYRWKDEPGSKASFQCDSILIVLRKMSTKTFVDDHGNEWPWWCGFELQHTKANNHTSNNKPLHDSIFNWLSHMIPDKSANGDTAEDGKEDQIARFNIEQLAKIVTALKACCVKHNQPLPNIEALPITIGMHDEGVVKEAKASLAKAERARNTTQNGLRRLQLCADATPVQIEQARSKQESAAKEADLAAEALDLATMDAATTVTTLPSKREMKKPIGSAVGRSGRESMSDSLMILDGKDTLKREHAPVQVESHQHKKVKYT